MPYPANIDVPCRCSASRRPYELPHDAECRWVPLSADMDTRTQQVDDAVERARQERDTRGPAKVECTCAVGTENDYPANAHTRTCAYRRAQQNGNGASHG